MSEHDSIVVSGHFSGSPQRGKLQWFERLDAALRPRGCRLLLLNLSSQPLETTCAAESIPLGVEIGEHLRLGGLLGGAPTAATGHAASILAEPEGLTAEPAVAKVRLFRGCVEDVLRRHRPRAAVLWHQFNAWHYSLPEVLAAHGVPFAYAEYGALPGTMAFDRDGQMALSAVAKAGPESYAEVSADDLERADRALEHLRAARTMRRATDARSPLPDDFAEARRDGRRAIFYAGQNDYASGMLPESLPEAKEHSPFFRDTGDALEELLRIAEAEGFAVLFKPHPLDRRDFAAIAERHRGALFLTRDADVYECIAQTDATATILSQVSYLAALLGKPVALLGRNPMSNKGCAHEAGSRAGVRDTLNAALNGEAADAQRDAFRRHAAALLRDELYPADDAMAGYFSDERRTAADFLLGFAKEGGDSARLSPILDRRAWRAYRAVRALDLGIRGYTRLRGRRGR
jgi:hypothetical protein